MINAATLYESKDGGKSRIVVGSKGAENMAEQFSKYNYLKSMTVTVGGGCIRGSLISTLWLIFFTLLFALPLGIGGAIYLGVYAKNNALTRVLRNAIDMISGIPSIIFGLVGGIIFLPIASASGASSGNIITGALTLACMILPIIIKSTEEKDTVRDAPARYVCRYIDDYHFEYGINLRHICEFAELCERTGNTVIPLRASLPNQCYVFVQSENKIGIINKGEMGYTDSKSGNGRPSENRRLVDEMNRNIGVSPAQCEAMKAGSMFGWHTPAADPKNYTEKGTPIKPKNRSHDAR